MSNPDQPSMYAVVPNHESRFTNHYDVVIAGAGFAGLAVAQRLRLASNGAGVRGRVLLIDKDRLGDGVTSACGAPVSIVRAMGAADSIQQVHDRLIIHTPRTQTGWPLPEPFCTFDYRRFCDLAFARTGAEFVQASVLGREGNTVLTSSGPVAGRVLVDATGWRAALAGGPLSTYVNRRWMAFGIEAEIACDFEPGLHFYFLPEVRDGYAWAFPCDGRVRFGVLSYLGRSKLHPALDTFLARFGVRQNQIHGGFLASGLREPVPDGVFVAGDAAGHCLPVTGEGIRTAVLAGWRCGELVAEMLEGRLSPEDAADAYREFVYRSRRKFRALLWANMVVLALPPSVIGRVAQFVSQPGPLRTFMTRYLSIFRSAAVTASVL